jgi:uncharacterized membrane protein
MAGSEAPENPNLGLPPQAPMPLHPPYGWGPPPRDTDGFAIAALVTGLTGVPFLPIIFGFVSRSRIKASRGMKTGMGMAIAGIVLGFVWIVLIVAVGVLAATGAFETQNADDFSGEEREVAIVIDRYEDELAEGEVPCSEILTSELIELTESGSTETCEEYYDVGLATDIDVSNIDIDGKRATAEADEAGDPVTFMLERSGGRWKIDGILAP